MTFVSENSKSFVLKYMSVQRKYTKSLKGKRKQKKTADIHQYWRVVFPPGGGTVHSPSRGAGLTRLLHRHKFLYFLFCVFLIFLNIFFSKLLSRLKQVSLSLLLEMRYTTSPALLVLCIFPPVKKPANQCGGPTFRNLIHG